MSPDRTIHFQRLLDEALALLDARAGEQWAAIDPRNLSTLAEATESHRALVERIEKFRATGEALLAALPEPMTTPSPALSGPLPPGNLLSVHRPISAKPDKAMKRSADSSVAHRLDRDFIGTKPSAIQIGDDLSEVSTWRRTYELVCQNLFQRDEERFERLPSNPRFISAQDRHDFALDQRILRSASEVVPGIFAEVHFSANSIRDRIVKLLDEFGLPHSIVHIYLRSERAA